MKSATIRVAEELCTHYNLREEWIEVFTKELEHYVQWTRNTNVGCLLDNPYTNVSSLVYECTRIGCCADSLLYAISEKQLDSLEICMITPEDFAKIGYGRWYKK